MVRFMAGHRSYFVRVSAGIAGALALCAGLEAGEPIQFSNQPTPAQLPPSSKPELRPSRALDFVKPDTSSLPGFGLPGGPQPNSSAARTQRQKDLLDQQKNWIFLTPADAQRTATPSANELFQVQEGAELGKEAPSSKVMEKFWQTSESKNPSAAKDSRRTPDSLRNPGDPAVRPGSPFREELRNPASASSPLDWGKFFNQSGNKTRSPLTDNASAGDLFGNNATPFGLSPIGPGGLDNAFTSTKPSADFKAFQNLLRPVAPAPAGGLNDPINSAFDASRQDLNPIVGQSSDSPFRTLRSSDPLSSFTSAGPRSSGVGGGLGDLGTSFGGSSFSLPAASSTPQLAPPKATFSFPVRQF